MQRTIEITLAVGAILLATFSPAAEGLLSHSLLRAPLSMIKDRPAGERPSSADLAQEELPLYVGAANGQLFMLKQKGQSVETVPLKTALPVFKSFGFAADKRRLLYLALKNGVPSGELYVEDLTTGNLQKISTQLVLEAAWSPAHDNQVAYTFSTGASFGLAIVETDSGNTKILQPSGVLADILQWDNSGRGLYYFQATTEYSYTRLEPRYASAVKRIPEKVTATALPPGFPVLETTPPEKLAQMAQGKATRPANFYSFQIASPDGRYKVSGEDLLGSGALFAATGSSQARMRIGSGHLLKVLRDGVVVRNFTAEGSKLEYIDWKGQTTAIGLNSMVSYNLPMANPTVTQGGIGYSAPGSCNLISHTGSPHSFAYDLQDSIGEHVLASADGLVVLTVSTVTCNSLDTDCSDYVPNCNQGTYLGNVVVIQHADGSYTNYAHMDKSSVQVAVGTNACQGLHVGRQGHTGSTNGTFNGCGDHLHFQRQSSPDIFGESIAVTFSDVPSNPLACGSNLVSGSTESSYSVSPTSQSFSSTTAGGIIDVTSTGPATCAWTATSNDSFITVVSGASGSGNGTVGYTVADNPDTTPRTGTMLVAGKVVTITQYGVGYVNQAPVVNAGTDRIITLPAGATLTGSVNDDGLPNPPAAVTTTWSMVSGPGIVTFGNANALSTTATFSLAGPYVLRLTADDGALSGNDELTVTLNNPNSGTLSGSRATTASQVNLTTEGTLDWAHWGRFNSTSFTHRSAVTQQISNYTRIGNNPAQWFNDSTIGYSWSNGTPTASATGTTTGIWIGGLNNGFQITVPADTTLKTLRFYVGVAAAQGRLTATLSDGSASPYVDTGLTSSGAANGVYTINFQATSSGQQLVVRWTTATTFIFWGNITLQAATLVDASGAPLNQPPVVNAGPDQSITLPNNTVNLMGTATDDGLPNPPGVLTTTWSMVSGPGTVNFNNPNQAVTSASFSAAGTYVLQLTAHDSQLSVNDQVSVTVSPGNQAPVVNAGTDQTITLPAGTNLVGTVNDDGLPSPPAAVTTTWSKVSGPGTVTFGNANALSTTATFSLAGAYVLRLTADDSLLSNNDDLTVTVNNAGAPGILSGSLTTTASQVNLTTEGTLDWAHWGRFNSTSFTRRNGVTQQISNYTRIGTSAVQWFNDNTTGYSWSNGTPTASATGTTTGIWIDGVNNGFQITVPADTTLKTLRVYVGVAAAQGRLTATLSDGSAPAYVNTGLTSSGAANGVYTINFQATSSGQQLVVRWTTASTLIFWGNITFQAATLVDASGAPVVNAGPDQSVTLPNNTVNLMGTATDDGLPNPPGVLTTTWSTVSGPGSVNFNNPNQAVTSASFSAAGTYVLQLTANDSQFSSSDQVIVTVVGNQAPSVNAGTNQTITLPASANLVGTVNDDGLPNPPAAVTSTWSTVSGPGTVTFGNPNALSTTASFSLAGTYVLRLTADDSSLSSSDDLTVTVNNAGPTGTPFITDNFNDTAGTLLTSHTPDLGGTWIKHPSSDPVGSSVISDTNRLRDGSAPSQFPPDEISLHYNNFAPANPDYDVEAVLRRLNGDLGSAGVAGRILSTQYTFYDFHYSQNDGYWALGKRVNGTFTRLAFVLDALVDNTDYSMKLEMRGTSLNCYVNGVQIIAVTDNSIQAAGFAGLTTRVSSGGGSNTTGIHLDSFNVTQATTPPSVSFVNDAFTDAAGTILPSHTPNAGGLWVKHTSFAGDMVISNANRVRAGSDTNVGYAYNNTTPPSANYSVSCVVRRLATTSGTASAGVAGRINPSASTLYDFTYSNSGENWVLAKRVAGTVTVLGTYTQILSNGVDYAIRLEMQGSTIRAYIDGVERVSVTDSSITAPGFAGIRLRAPNGGSNLGGYHIDSFDASVP